jgi:large subunit ribosomal protein L21
MYAIIEDGGRQFRVVEGERIEVDLRAAKAGDTLEFSRVLFLGGETPKVGAPYVENARVKGQVEAEVKDKKLISYRYTRREQYHRKVGHRQRHLRVRITEIVAG